MKPHNTALTRALIVLMFLSAFVGCSNKDLRPAAAFDTISPEAFMNPPLEARPGAYWCWLNGHVDLKQMTREMEEAKALGMRGFEIWDIGVYRPVGMVPAGPAFLGEDSLRSIKHAISEAKRLGLELNMIAASSWNAGGAWVKKSDGSKRIDSSSLTVTGPQKLNVVLPLPCDRKTYYSDISVLAVPQSEDKKLDSPDLGIDLTGNMNDKGELTWDVPEGNWTILRFVCCGTNQGLVVPSPNSDGLLIDHLSAEATERHMLHMINKLGEIDPGHKILKIMSHDSYEVHAANDWTEDFVDEFKKRRGYDPARFLPLLEGWTLNNQDVQTRFLADYRKTVGELITERHFRVSREVLNRHGMELCAEAGHGGYARVDPIWALGESDIPRGEFWNGKRFWVTKEAASAAHLYGRRFVDSESFTGWRHWLDGPLHYKQLFDVALCAGLNRLTFHTFAHNPPEAGLPGYVYHAGEHFNANNTWWKQSGPMLLYMARCSYLMQRGDFVADVCFYYGDQAPNLVPSRRIDPNITPLYSLDKCLHCGRPVPVDFRPLGSGYDYDYIDANSIINRMTVDPETGQLVVGEMKYRLMVLPKQDHINLDVLQKIRTLVKQGATILGTAQPIRTNSLTDYPAADRMVAKIGTELWGAEKSNDDTVPRSRKFGNGTVYTKGTSRQVLAEMGVTPDFTVLQGGSQDGPDRVDYIHRRTDNADIYFVCNGAKETKTLLCRFRDAEGRPEIWDPVSGDIYFPKAVSRMPDSSCHIELEFPAFGSAFVVFRRDGHPSKNPAYTFEDTSTEKISINGKWTVKFQPGRLAPESVEWDELIDWTSSEEPGIKYFSGTATYSIRFNMAVDAAGDFWLDLGEAKEVGEVSIDGKDLGTVWTFPFRVKVPAKLLSKGSHMLDVKVTNVWNNRLVGDQFLREEERITRTNMQGAHTKDSPLIPSGLVGPVTLQPVKVYPGADERTPSYSQYFSWINNTNEGSTEGQTKVNLDFFKWLHDEYGMVLDIYVISAGAIDKAGRYGKMDSDAFRRQFPNGFGPIYEKAKTMGTRLGTWGGPDGFGDTPEEEQARIDMMVKLCRDYEFILFKFDAVVGRLRPEKQDAFVRMMTECRKYSPDLILLNHRLKLGKGMPHATTYLLGGEETYVDVHMVNKQTAPHHRAGAISRRIVPNLARLTEDHGICISSCLNYWEDDLILQAFNRNLILAPQIYGNPWFLRDDEYPKLARIFNLARKYRDILVDGMVLPEERYGEKAVSRGDDRTRLLTLRNLGWTPIICKVKLDEEIGLSTGTDVEIRQYHPTERIIGIFQKGDVVDVQVMPFRSCLLMATSKPSEFGIKGCDYEVVRDVPGKPVLVKLLAMPGVKRNIELVAGNRKFTSARISGLPFDVLVNGGSATISFPGTPLKDKFHRKLGDLTPCAVPADAEALYEATCFAADNNALEVRALQRSGPSLIPQVKKAREAFLEQELFVERGLWDKNLFDGDDETAFYVARRVGVAPLEGGSLRIDFGETISLEKLVIRTGSEYALQPFKYDETVRAYVSSDLKNWTGIKLAAGKDMVMNFDPKRDLRYIRFDRTPDKIAEIEGYLGGKKLDRSKWRASILFARYSRVRPEKAWQHSFTLEEIPKGSYLAIALNGEHGVEGAYAASRVDGEPVGAPDRSVSFPANTWEYPVRKRSADYTYYVPLTEDMIGKKIDAVVLGMKNVVDEFRPEVWITAYPAPLCEQILTLTEEGTEK